MGINKEYKNLVRSLKDLYLDFNEDKININAILYTYPDVVENKIKQYKHSLNGLFAKFFEVAVKKYPYLQGLKSEWEKNNMGIKFFPKFAEVKLNLLRQNMESKNNQIFNGALAVSYATSATLTASTILLLLNKSRPYEISTAVNLAITTGAIITGVVASHKNKKNFGKFSFLESCNLVNNVDDGLNEIKNAVKNYYDEVNKDIENGITVSDLEALISEKTVQVEQMQVKLNKIYQKPAYAKDYKLYAEEIKKIKSEIFKLKTEINYLRNKIKFMKRYNKTVDNANISKESPVKI